MSRLHALFAVACFAVVLSPLSHAQDSIPNASFEQWTAGEPDGWRTSNVDPVFAITQVADAQSGNWAAHGEVFEIFSGVNLQPVITASTASEAGIPISQRWIAVRGYYKFNPVGGDRFVVIVQFSAASTIIATGVFADSNTVSTYQEFVVNMDYFTSDNPDTAFISVVVLGPGSSSSALHLGTEFFVDNVSLSDVSLSVDEQTDLLPAVFELQNYPNPFNPSTTISYFIPQTAQVDLQVFNVLGQSVRTLLQEVQSAGSHSVIWNGTDDRGAVLPSGIYFYRLQSADQFLVNRMLLLK